MAILSCCGGLVILGMQLKVIAITMVDGNIGQRNWDCMWVLSSNLKKNPCNTVYVEILFVDLIEVSSGLLTVIKAINEGWQ